MIPKVPISSEISFNPLQRKVYLNGNLLKREEDYIIDYTYGIIYFNFIISSQDEILVEYEISGTTEIYNILGIGIGYLHLN